MDIFGILTMVGGLALFLFGMALMGDGLKRVAGNKLELILYRLTGNPLKGFLLGAEQAHEHNGGLCTGGSTVKVVLRCAGSGHAGALE